MNWKGSGRKRSWTFFGAIPAFSGETEENHENLSHNSRSPGRDLNPGPPEYEAGVLTT
jgi:hypothetical protein